jgi:hypothetical protein
MAPKSQPTKSQPTEVERNPFGERTEDTTAAHV